MEIEWKMTAPPFTLPGPYRPSPRLDRTALSSASVMAIPAAFAWLYGDVLAGLARQWATDDNYSHGFLVIPLAAFFAWERRRTLVAAAARPTMPLGLFVLTTSLLLF